MGTRPGRFRAHCHLQRLPMRCGACLHCFGGYYWRGKTSPDAAATVIDAVANLTTIGYPVITLKNDHVAPLQPHFDCCSVGP